MSSNTHYKISQYIYIYICIYIYKYTCRKIDHIERQGTIAVVCRCIPYLKISQQSGSVGNDGTCQLMEGNFGKNRDLDFSTNTFETPQSA